WRIAVRRSCSRSRWRAWRLRSTDSCRARGPSAWWSSFGPRWRSVDGGVAEHAAHDLGKSGMGADGVPERKSARPQDERIASGHGALGPANRLLAEPGRPRRDGKPGRRHELVARPGL